MSTEIHSAAYLREMRSVIQSGMDTRLKSVVTKLESRNLDRDGILRWANESLEFAQLGVVVAAQAMGLERFDVDAWTGVQAAGKGTMERTIQESVQIFISRGHETLPASLKKLIESNTGEIGRITTGTGGIFYMPESGTEYEEFFGPIGKISSPYTSNGELVPDEFVGTMVAQVMARRILQGAKGSKNDLFPRSGPQYEQMILLMQKLYDAGINSDLTMVDFRLLPDEVIDDIKGNREVYSEAAKNIGKLFNDWHKANKATGFSERSVGEQYDQIDTFIGSSQLELPEKSPQWWLCEEAKEAINRMKPRGRPDDQPYAIMKRLASYYGSTMPELVKVESVKFISSLPEPDDVAESLIRVLIDKNEQENYAVEEFIDIARQKAKEIVYGIPTETALEPSVPDLML